MKRYPRSRWNPRYVVYAARDGLTPKQALRRDAKLYIGGKMMGFILWIDARWTEFRALQKMGRDDPAGDDVHAAFDAWLPTVAKPSEGKWT